MPLSRPVEPLTNILPSDRGSLLDAAFHRLGLSARAVHRILKVARTIADRATRDRIAAAHVAEAIQYRQPAAGDGGVRGAAQAPA
jgi:magnesium chelatase family protein